MMRYNVANIIGAAGVGLILWFTLQAVEPRWCVTDVRLTYAVTALCATSIFLALFTKNDTLKQRNIHFGTTDVLVCGWWVAIMSMVCLETQFESTSYAIKSTQMLLLYTTLRILLSATGIKGNVIATSIIICGVYEALVGVSQCLFGGSRHHLYPLTGTFFNPGPYSLYPSIALVAICRILRNKKKFLCLRHTHCAGIKLPLPVRNKTLLVAAGGVCLLALVFSCSRAAWFSVATMLIIMNRRRLTRHKWLAAGCAIALAIIVYLFKQGSANGRLLIDLISLRNILGHPVCGTGPGSFPYAYAEEVSAYFRESPFSAFTEYAGVPEYAFNDLLLIGVEQGAVGILFAIGTVALTLRHLYHKERTLLYVFTTIIIFSLFSYPLELLPYQVVAVTLIACSQSLCGNDLVSGATTSGSKTWVKRTACTCLLLATGIASTLQGLHLSKRVEREAEYKRFSGLNDGAFINSYYELLPDLKDNPSFLFEFAKILAKEKRYNDSNAILRYGILCSSDPMFFTLRGNNFREMKLYDYAESEYEKAFYIAPNRLYPLYCLSLLYKETGEQEKLSVTLSRIRGFKEKVKSPATEEMRRRIEDQTKKKARKNGSKW